MLEGYRKRVNTGAGIGLLSQILAISLVFDDSMYNPSVKLIGVFTFLLGTVLFIYGLCMYAKGKGRHWMWGLLGIFNLMGLLILVFLKELPAESINSKLPRKIWIVITVTTAIIGVLLLYAMQR
ncbi:MAG: hypothetical protein JW734_07265 [Candidatus Omnitrophica bacterium]|nr:hypothetical protein [Candidatus Omnitrophota bacterium]